MSYRIKRLLSIILALLMLAGTVTILEKKDARAESVNVTLYAIPMKPKKGDAVTICISVSGVQNSTYKINVSYDSKILQFDSCRNGDATRDGSLITITGKVGTQPNLDFTAIGEGTMTVMVSGVSASTAEGENLTIGSSSMTLVVGEGDPSTEEKTTEEKDTEEGETTEVSDSGIFANVEVEIDGEKYTVVNDDSITNIPEGFSPVPSSYDGDLIRGFSYGEDEMTILCLKSSSNAMSFFVYDEPTKALVPYHEFEQGESRFVISPVSEDTEIPEGYKESVYNVDEGKIPVYTQDNGENIYLVNVTRLGKGTGLYYFDPEDQSFVRYYNPVDSASMADAEQEVTTEKSEPSTSLLDDDKPIGEEDIVSYGTLKGLLILFIILFAIAAIAVVILIFRLGKANDYYDYYDDEYEDSDEEHGSHRKVKKQDAEQSDKETVQGETDGNASEGNTDEKADVNDEEKPAEEKKDDTPKPKILFSDVNTETGGIIVEEALLNNANVGVLPKTYEERQDKFKKAMEERPYGIDSAFDVVPGDVLPEEPVAETEQTVEEPAAKAENVEEAMTAENKPEENKSEESKPEKKQEAKPVVKKEKKEEKIVTTSKGTKLELPSLEDDED